MLDIRTIREEPEAVQKGLEAKRGKVDLDGLVALDQKRRQLIAKVDELRAQKNAANDEISKAIQEKKDPKSKIAAMKKVSAEINTMAPELKEIEAKLNIALLTVPNLPNPGVPVGGADQNKVIRSWKEPKKLGFTPKSHIEIAEHLDIVDFKRGAKVAGSNFLVYKNEGARLERALFNFMLDLHTNDHGYREVFPPFLVNTDSMVATGQLPKMKEDMYRLAEDDLYLIPTAEVPVTNMHRDEVLNGKDLPYYYTAYTACFRREAGSYGKDTRGMVRVHQFNKVELVKFVRPEDSEDELEELVANAEKVLQLLKLPYRVVLLASGELSFAAAQCYDLEAHAAGMDKWLEVSSCSSFGDFQARRGNIRYKTKDMKKPAYVHTLNGSGLALARTMIAILENYQTRDGGVEIPKVLRPYMGGIKKIQR